MRRSEFKTLVTIGIIGAILAASIYGGYIDFTPSTVSAGDDDDDANKTTTLTIENPYSLPDGMSIDSASYIIFKNGTLTCAKNGETGYTEFYGINASDVIQDAVDSVADNSTIILKEGNYVLTSPISIDGRDGLDIISNGATLTLNDGFTSTFDANYVTLGIKDSTNIVISGLSFDGNSDDNTGNYNGLYLTGNDYVVVEKCQFQNYYHNAICFYNDMNRGVMVQDCYFLNNALTVGNHEDVLAVGEHYAQFIKCYFYRDSLTVNGAQAFYLNCTGSFNINDCYFKNIAVAYDFRTGHHSVSGGTVDTCDIVVIAVSTNCSDPDPIISISNVHAFNVFGRLNVARGITIAAGQMYIDNVHIVANATSSYNTVGIGTREYLSHAPSRCVITNCILEGFDYGLMFSQCDGGHTVTGNTIKDCPVGIYSRYHVAGDARISCADNFFDNVTTPFSDYDNYLAITGNLGYVTYNAGQAVIPAGNTSVVIVHGLSATPTNISLTGSSNDTSALWVTSIDATNFTINVPAGVGGNRTVYWRAEI